MKVFKSDGSNWDRDLAVLILVWKKDHHGVTLRQFIRGDHLLPTTDGLQKDLR